MLIRLPVLLLCVLLLPRLTAQAEVRMTHGPLPTQAPLVPHRAYPTYGHYERIMYALADRYPRRCRVEEWGTLPSGRRILALRLAAPGRRSRPQVHCSAAMHGDETGGYWVLLRLAEHLLAENPGGLLGDVVVYINPLANPDGTYLGGNHTVAGAQRGNTAGVDLNRNYPDPDDGPHPDGHAYQPETLIFMRAAREHSFDLGINLHGGAELFNYPWDTYRHRHPDNEWWRRVSREFANRAQRASPGVDYFVDRHNGVTNGHDWYPIAGSRQDYMNYYHRCREATVEISMAKIFPARELPELWDRLRPALLGYLNEARLGIHGTVTDHYTGRPLRALVTIDDHDRSNSAVYSNERDGRFYRYLAAGRYRLRIIAEGYAPQFLSVTVRDGQRTEVQTALRPSAVPARK